MASPFSVEDAFTVGVSFDLLGGLLLARGVLASPLQIAVRTTRPTMWGNSFNNAEAASQLRSRADASAGLISLAIGFLLQAGGYVALIGGAKIDTGAVRALWAVGLMIAAAALAYLAFRKDHERRVLRLAVEVARSNPVTGQTEDDPDRGTLYALGSALGYPGVDVTPQGVVDLDGYARRHFGVRVGQRYPIEFPAPGRR
jgi:hypothetical protein